MPFADHKGRCRIVTIPQTYDASIYCDAFAATNYPCLIRNLIHHGARECARYFHSLTAMEAPVQESPIQPFIVPRCF